MNRPAFLMYTCRLCNETFPEGHAPDGILALAVAEGKAPMPTTWGQSTPGLLTIHHGCTSGDIGMAELVGVVFDSIEGDVL